MRRAPVIAILLAALALLLSAAGITEEKLKNAQADATTWLSYGKNYSGWRFADLTQINAANVARLAPKWIFQTGLAGKFETTPLVFDRLMFVTGPSNHAYALDALTGRPIWHYQKNLPNGVSICCGQVNRGFGAKGDKLYKVNLESTLVALDGKTGATVWETQIDDIKKGYSATVAPLVAKNLVVVGIAGAEFGVRGFIDAFDADTGKKVWRFYTVAGEGDPGRKSWGGDSWKRGGGSSWITGTYDPELNLIYWGTGNPGPDMNGDDRPGDNLYTCSVVALDADTGKLKWHYQFTPHDVHDWDAIADPVLIDVTVKGRPVKAVVQANRNGFYYVLNRATGELLAAKNYTKVTWADGIGADGRPNLIAGQDPLENGNQSCPGIGGGHNWQSTAYSPGTRLYYFTSTDGCQIYFKTKQQFIEGQWYQGSTAQGLPTEPTVGSVIAVDPATGVTKWRTEAVTPLSGGLLATAGGLVFVGDREGYLMALDASTGKILWKFQTGGMVIAPPISYSMDGKQYVAVAAGASMLTFTLP
ncbi:MAG TPA: PQQ-dependent dehydrogenase, methanol/ethanol family [Bryobacteraceae bacterium]|nr:PQQ-dependent dehydrogenase, methanol/ethanol family [Bryobacteraceae bacterium]